jgi:glycerophosphoryl diester phosphodiesterase
MDIVVDKLDTPSEIFTKACKKVMVQGHRGGFKPDNTLRGFSKALEAGL